MPVPPETRKVGSRTQVTHVLVYVTSEYRYLKKEHLGIK